MARRALAAREGEGPDAVLERITTQTTAGGVGRELVFDARFGEQTGIDVSCEEKPMPGEGRGGELRTRPPE